MLKELGISAEGLHAGVETVGGFDTSGVARTLSLRLTLISCRFHTKMRQQKRAI